MRRSEELVAAAVVELVKYVLIMFDQRNPSVSVDRSILHNETRMCLRLRRLKT